jgi:hypothetical protein
MEEFNPASFTVVELVPPVIVAMVGAFIVALVGAALFRGEQKFWSEFRRSGLVFFSGHTNCPGWVLDGLPDWNK